MDRRRCLSTGTPSAAGEGTSGTTGRAARRTGSGPGRILVAVYAVFALAATGRASLQISEDFGKAPLAYSLSALAAVIYLVATVALARGDRTSVRVATIACSIELVGVLTVGWPATWTARRSRTRRSGRTSAAATATSRWCCPVLGLLWLRANRRHDARR